jgi:hypothetical protein
LFLVETKKSRRILERLGCKLKRQLDKKKARDHFMLTGIGNLGRNSNFEYQGIEI